MTFDQYQEGARRTMDLSLMSEEKLDHAILGLTSEAGEAAGILQKVYQGHPHPLIDEVEEAHMIKELGDCLWMLAEAADALGVSLDYIARTNIEKLKVRYPLGFEADKSLHRKDGDI